MVSSHVSVKLLTLLQDREAFDDEEFAEALAKIDL